MLLERQISPEVQNLIGGSKAGCQKILLPFESLCLLEPVLRRALDVARQTSAELVLLRVQPSTDIVGSELAEEYLFSELRSLQAQLQRWSVPARIDTAFGPAASAILSYAAEHDFDLIILPAGAEAGVGRDARDTVAGVVARAAHCPTMVVRQN